MIRDLRIVKIHTVNGIPGREHFVHQNRRHQPARRLHDPNPHRIQETPFATPQLQTDQACGQKPSLRVSFLDQQQQAETESCPGGSFP